MRIAGFRLLSPDPARLRAFYVAAFGARETPHGFDLGEARIEVAASAGGAAEFAANATGFQHFALVVADIAKAYAALGAKLGWKPISLKGPEKLPPASGGASAFKFRDPDGHPLELLEFPSSAVPDDWRARFASDPERLYAGIDHTAIAVRDARETSAFYAALGFSETHRQTNRGPEQARLDGLSGARSAEVVVVSLTPANGGRPGVELLEYRAPPTFACASPDGSAGATSTLLRGDRHAQLVDPDGHRLSVSNDI